MKAKDDQMKAKDEQIKELMRIAKKPRIVTNNTTTNNNNVEKLNLFGQETTDHIPDTKLQEFLQDPYTAIARMVRLKHSLELNRNVQVPNKREQWIKVAREVDGEKVWQMEPKAQVLNQMVEENAMALENEAADDTASFATSFAASPDRAANCTESCDKAGPHQDHVLGRRKGRAGRLRGRGGAAPVEATALRVAPQQQDECGQPRVTRPPAGSEPREIPIQTPGSPAEGRILRRLAICQKAAGARRRQPGACAFGQEAEGRRQACEPRAERRGQDDGGRLREDKTQPPQVRGG